MRAGAIQPSDDFSDPIYGLHGRGWIAVKVYPDRITLHILDRYGDQAWLDFHPSMLADLTLAALTAEQREQLLNKLTAERDSQPSQFWVEPPQAMIRRNRHTAAAEQAH